MKRNLITVLLVSAALTFAACSSDEPEITNDPASALIAVDGSTEFVIVRPDVKPTADEISGTTKLQKAIADATGAKLDMGTDFVKAGSTFVEKEFEILIGATNRDATAKISAEAPRSRDWAIAREGGKVVIYGTDALPDALDYFVEHYIRDGNIYIPDGEKYIHTAEYKLDSFTIGGRDISEFSIHTDAGQEIELLAASLANYIAESYGFTPDVVTRTPEGPAIRLMLGGSTGALNNHIYMDGDNLVAATGMLADPAETVDYLLAHFDSAAKSGSIAIDKSIDLLYSRSADNMIIADAAYLADLDAKADRMKANVLGTKSDYTVGDNGTVYYFAEDGNDANDGKSETSPKKSLAALSELTLKPGDVVLFRRGDTFRGKIEAQSGVSYSAYGEGDKPTIAGSLKNYADASLWQASGTKNVWKLTEKLQNVGIIVFDYTGKIGNYEEKTGLMKISDGVNVKLDSLLKNDLEFYSDMKTGELFVYSEKNPGERFKVIEIGTNGHVIQCSSRPNITIDNLHVTLTGSHGVNGYKGNNLVVRNCVFDWLGGSILGDAGSTTRYGNAVQVYGSCDGYYVYNNWMYQIYDTGITHQYSWTPTTKVNNMNNVEYYDNLVEYCFWSIEYYNSKQTVAEGEAGADVVRNTTNVYVHDNFCRFGGEGWGCIGRAGGAQMYALGISGETIENYVTENNIFDRCTGYLMTYAGNDAIVRGNTYIQRYGKNLVRVAGEKLLHNADSENHLRLIGETDAEIVYVIE